MIPSVWENDPIFTMTTVDGKEMIDRIEIPVGRRPFVMRDKTNRKQADKAIGEIIDLIQSKKFSLDGAINIIKGFNTLPGTHGSGVSVQENVSGILPAALHLYRIVNDSTYVWNPPAPVVPYGRMNKAGESVFYLAFDPAVAVAERGENDVFLNTYAVTNPLPITISYKEQFQSNLFCRIDRQIGKHLAYFYNSLLGLKADYADEEWNSRVYQITNYVKTNDFSINFNEDYAIVYSSVKMKGTSETTVKYNQNGQMILNTSANLAICGSTDYIKNHLVLLSQKAL